MKLVKFSVAIFVALAAVCFAAGTNDQGTFAKANGDFAASHFDDAISGYEQLVQSGKWSATLSYDLGNAYFRAGNSGKAILNYARALALEPKQPEATANLRLVRDQARALEMRRSEIDRYLDFASSAHWAIGAATGFWVAAFAAGAWIFRRRLTAITAILFVGGLTLCVVGAWAAWKIETGSHGRSLAVVTTNNVQARLATADNSAAVLALPPGSEVKVLSTRGDWVYAALPNDLRGWIPANAAERVRL